jgi:RNA polymerase sigma factor (sigma-70 family)
MEKESKDTDTQNQKPWNLWFQQAQNGIEEAAQNIIVASQPFINSLYKDPLFRNRLGTDEIRSIANFALVKFIRRHNRLPKDAEVPFLLRCVIRRDLRDSVCKLDAKEQHEQLARPVQPQETATDDAYADNACNEAVSTDASAEPEARYLNNELCDSVREAVRQLPETEKTVIHALYYQNKDMKEIARDLHCSFQYAYKTRRNAYARLHKMLKGTVQA